MAEKMSSEEFLGRITAMFPMLGKSGPPFEAKMFAITSLIDSMDETDIGLLFQAFENTYDSDRVPSKATFYKLIGELGIKTVMNNKGFPMYRCECGAEFPINLYRCGSCQAKTGFTVFRSFDPSNGRFYEKDTGPTLNKRAEIDMLKYGN